MAVFSQGLGRLGWKITEKFQVIFWVLVQAGHFVLIGGNFSWTFCHILRKSSQLLSCPWAGEAGLYGELEACLINWEEKIKSKASWPSAQTVQVTHLLSPVGPHLLSATENLPPPWSLSHTDSPSPGTAQTLLQALLISSGTQRQIFGWTDLKP